MAVLDLGKVTRTDSEINAILDKKLNGYSFYENPEGIYLVADDTPYQDGNGKYILAVGSTGQSLLQDTDTYKSAVLEGNYYSVGADTLSPFKAGGGDSLIPSPWEYPIMMNVNMASTSIVQARAYLPPFKYQKLVIKSLKLTGKKSTTSTPHPYVYFEIYGTKKGATGSSRITYLSVYVNGTTEKTATFSDTEVDISEYESIDYCVLSKGSGSGSVYALTATVNGSLELYF